MQSLESTLVDLKGPGRMGFRVAVPAGRSDPYLDRIRRGDGGSPVAQLLLALSRRGEKVVDIGANIGAIAAPLAVAGRSVLAVEALAENYALLVQTSLANSETSLQPVHAAVVESFGTLALEGTSAYARVDLESTAGATPGVPLTALVAAHEFHDAAVVKLDVEGSELAAIRGGKAFLSGPGVRAVVYEANGAHCDRAGYRPADLARNLEWLGFRCFLVDGKAFHPVDTDGFQWVGNAECVALKGDELPDGYHIAQTRLDDMVPGIEDALAARNHRYRWFMVHELDRASDEIVRAPKVVAALRRLRSDEETIDRTRAAAERVLCRVPADT